MRKFVDFAREEKGLSLVELIASLSILSLVMGTIYAVITFGFTAYNKVTVENSLRDEADMMMSAVMTQLYTYGPEYVSNIANENGIELSRTTKLNGTEIPRKQMKIYNSGLYIADATAANGTGKVDHLQSVLLDGSSIQLDCGNASACRDGLIRITLVLEQEDKKHVKHQLKMESRFGF
ncbi:prepilin-type N-terminal cleavage/methylation domain-containing protein [Paenibacillus sp. GCM10023248]|uniref:prepilin-type N-terminal cleavage/methylation domain-containing protein n=1 Tax=unclassified Paenibacillus TaxID=185978 RepID=UPI0023794512|nr:prepilin-type N-terminal cleavage/methylation domain-containing protein [Paenibacillus sp. MAHUQ-63]MDD9267819.1 prepilin-type N-terminal cleavage/methylation domain-containing protein [Paenibacillus sp. MAHUQ-63]